MLLETLSDFFLFISTDKKVITDKDLKAFEYFISKQFPNIDPQNSQKLCSKDLDSSTSSIPKISKNINTFISELLFYLHNQNIIQLDSNYQHSIESKSIDIYKQKFSTSNGSSNYIYQEQQKRNTHLKQIKNKETKKLLIRLLKTNKLKFKIEPEYYINFFNFTGKYAKVVSEFMNKMKKWYDLYKGMLDKNKSRISDDNCNLSDDKSNYDNKSGLSGISYDKENIVKDKKKFLDVLDRMRDNNKKEKVVNENDINVEIEQNINDNKEKNYIIGENGEESKINKSKENIKSISNDGTNAISGDISNSNHDNNKKNNNINNKRKKNKDDCDHCCTLF